MKTARPITSFLFRNIILHLKKRRKLSRRRTTLTRKMETQGQAGVEGRWWSQQNKAEQLVKLAQETSPLYVYDGTTVDKALAQLRDMSGIDSFFYALKANPNPDGTSFSVLLSNPFFFKKRKT